MAEALAEGDISFSKFVAAVMSFSSVLSLGLQEIFIRQLKIKGYLSARLLCRLVDARKQRAEPKNWQWRGPLDRSA